MNSLIDIKKDLQGEMDRVNEGMSSCLESGIRLLDRVDGAILAGKGKQLRPLLSLLVSHAVKPDCPLNDSCIDNAIAAELLHNATLLHDDVADQSSTRRGAPTINALMGPSASVLVGDYWLSKAVETIIRDGGPNDVVVALYAKTLGDLSKGEMLQLEKAFTGDTTIEDYYSIIYCKTASLFETVSRVASILAGASKQVEDAVGEYARKMGMAFQIRDDIFDYCPGMDIGKPVGADILEKKMTLPLLEALSQVGPDEEKNIRNIVKEIDDKPSDREVIARFVSSHNGIALAQERLSEWIDSARECLDILPASKYRDYLGDMALYLRNRQK